MICSIFSCIVGGSAGITNQPRQRPWINLFTNLFGNLLTSLSKSGQLTTKTFYCWKNLSCVKTKTLKTRLHGWGRVLHLSYFMLPSGGLLAQTILSGIWDIFLDHPWAGMSKTSEYWEKHRIQSFIPRRGLLRYSLIISKIRSWWVSQGESRTNRLSRGDWSSNQPCKPRSTLTGIKLDRPQSLFYFVPQEKWISPPSSTLTGIKRKLLNNTIVTLLYIFAVWLSLRCRVIMLEQFEAFIYLHRSPNLSGFQFIFPWSQWSDVFCAA